MAEKVSNKTPKNVAAERGVLAGLVKFGNDIYSDIQDICSESVFTDTDNQIIYKCCKLALEKSDNKEIDMASIFAAGTALGLEANVNSKEQRDYIRSLYSLQIEKESVRKHATMLKKLEIARKGQDVSRDIYYKLSEVNGTESINSILSVLEEPLINFTTKLDDDDSEKTTLIWEGAEELLAHLAENPGGIMGIPSPWARYNEAIGGGRRRGGVYLIGARPKAGKSTMAINDAIHVATKLNIPVLYLDTEMTLENQQPRVLANIAQVQMRQIESGEFAQNDYLKIKIMERLNEVKGSPLYYRKVAGKEFTEILSIVRRWVTQEVGMEDGRRRDCIIIYDYFKLMTSESLEDMEEFQALGFQISALSDFCKQYDVTCQSYVQLNRDGITKETSDIISQSDRLLWLCSSFAILKSKTKDEILLDGPANGNTKLIPTVEQRFGPGLQEGDWINLHIERDKCIITEGKTNFELKATRDDNMSGFNFIEGDDEQSSGEAADDYDDEEFDRFDYGDDKYRKDGPLRTPKRDNR